MFAAEGGPETVASRRTRGLIDNISFGTPVWPATIHRHSGFFRENASVTILAADRKRSFWAAWTVMNNCRPQFGWQCRPTQLKESAIRRVVERQV